MYMSKLLFENSNSNHDLLSMHFIVLGQWSNNELSVQFELCINLNEREKEKEGVTTDILLLYLQIIRCGDLDSYPLLHKLMLSSNELHFIEDDALGRLEIISILYLDHNHLDHIPISLPSSLIELHLEHNEIVELHANALMQLKSLEILNLSGNPLVYLPGLPLPHLLKLIVRGCHLENVNQLVVKMSPRLKDIYLEDNPIKCADLLGIAEWASPCRDSMTDTSMATTTTGVVMYDDNYVRQHGHASCYREMRKKKKVNRICHVQALSELESGHQENDENNSSVSDNVTTTTANTTKMKNKKTIQLGHVGIQAKGINQNKKKQQQISSTEKKKYSDSSHKKQINNLNKKKLYLRAEHRGHAFEEHFNDIQYPFDKSVPLPVPQEPTQPPPPASSSLALNNCSVNASAFAEQWVDSTSQVTGHPGLFMVIGVTIGMITAFGLVYLYKRRPMHHFNSSHRFEMNNYVAASASPLATLNYHQAMNAAGCSSIAGGYGGGSDLLHMDHLTQSSSSSSSPIELW